MYFDRLDWRNNKGFNSRATAAATSRLIHLSVPIFSPITTQDKLLIPGVDMYIRMLRARDTFLMMSTATEPIKVRRPVEPATDPVTYVDTIENRPLNPRLDIGKFLSVITNLTIYILVNIKLLVRKYKLMPLLHMDIMNTLRLSPALYPVTQKTVIEFSKVAGTTLIRETLFTDRILPKTVYLFIVSTKRRLGDYELSPWNIEWNELREAKLISGNESFPRIPYKPEVEASDVIEPYQTMLRTTNSLELGQSNGINVGNYMSGYGLLCFDMSRSYLPGQMKTMDTPQLSDLQLHLDFKSPLYQQMSFICILVSFVV